MTRRPIYQVIYNDFAARITAGELAPNDRLPSELALAEQFGVSRMTVRHALDLLEDDRLLLRRQGTGTFVASKSQPVRRLNRLASFRDELGISDAAVETDVKRREVLPPPDDVREALELKRHAVAVHLVRVRLVDGVAASLQDSWVPYAIAPALARTELENGSLYQTLRQQGVVLGFADQQISAAAVDEQQAEWLGVKVGSPVMLITRTTHSTTLAPVEFARSLTLPQFPLHVRLEG